MGGGRGRGRAVSLTRSDGAFPHDGVLAGRPCRGFFFTALLTGQGGRRTTHGVRDTGAYVVTRFIDLAEQRRTCGGSACARAMMSSCALFWRISVVCGRPTSSRAARLVAPPTLIVFSTLTQTHGPCCLVRAAPQYAPFSTASRGRAITTEQQHASSLAAEGVLAEVWTFPERKPGAC